MRTGGVIAAIASALAAELPSPWRRSVFEPTAVLHADGGPQGFTWSIEIPRTSVTFGRRMDSLTDATAARPAEDRVVVRWAHPLRADSKVDSYDEALVAEDLFVDAIFGHTSRTGLGALLLEELSREVGSGVVVGTITLRVPARPYTIA